MYHLGAEGRFEPFLTTPFADLEQVLEDWVERIPTLRLVSGGSHNPEFRVWLGEAKLLHHWFRREWVGCILPAPTPDEVAQLRARLTRPGDVKESQSGVSCRLVSQGDLDLVERIVEARMHVR